MSSADRYASNAVLVTHRWFAPDGVDLDEPVIQAARAYRESDNLYGITGNIDAAYAGYPDQFRSPREAETYSFPRVGTIDDHILDVREVRDTLGRTVTRILICEDRTGVAEPTGSTWTVRETDGGVVRLAVSPIDTTTTAVTVDPDHRLPYPTWNVFDGWKVENDLIDAGHLDPIFDFQNPEDAEIYDRCSRARQPRLNPDVEPDDVLTTAPTVETPIPGWPTEIGQPG